jgi:hypothetical protein
VAPAQKKPAPPDLLLALPFARLPPQKESSITKKIGHTGFPAPDYALFTYRYRTTLSLGLLLSLGIGASFSCKQMNLTLPLFYRPMRKRTKQFPLLPVG